MTTIETDPTPTLDLVPNGAEPFGTEPFAEMPAPEPSAAPVDPTGGRDPEAPYGRKRDGTPKAKPGARPRHAGPAAGRSARSATPPRARATRSTQRPAAVPDGPDYEKGVKAILRWPMVALAGAALAAPPEHSLPLRADLAVVNMHAPGIIAETAALARQHPNNRASLYLAKLAELAPYQGLAEIAGAMAVQIAANHGWIPRGLWGQFGANDPERLVAAFESQMQPDDDDPSPDRS